MKFVAWALVIILLAVIAGGAYLFMSTNVTIEVISLTTYPANEWEAHFQDYKQRLLNGTVLGTVYTNTPLTESSDYSFYSFSVGLKNASFLNAQMVEIQIVPVEGDVLQFLGEPANVLPARSTGTFSTTILSSNSVHNVRQIVVTYYLWGYQFTVTKTYG